MRTGDEADNRQQQKHQHTNPPKAAQPKVERGRYGQQKADDAGDVHRASAPQN
jgi:hypothetical protein